MQALGGLYDDDSDGAVLGCIGQPPSFKSPAGNSSQGSALESPSKASRAQSDFGADLYKDPDMYMDAQGFRAPNAKRRPSPARRATVAKTKSRAESAGRVRPANRAPPRAKKATSAPKNTKRPPLSNSRRLSHSNDPGNVGAPSAGGPQLSDWARNLVADVASGWKSESLDNEPEWAKSMTKPNGKKAMRSPRSRDPMDFDNWEERSSQNWSKAYKDALHSSFSEPRKPKSHEAFYGIPQQKPRRQDRYTESWEQQDKKKGGWNSSTEYSNPYTGGSSGGSSGKDMERDMLIQQLKAQRNRAEKDRDKIMSVARSYLDQYT